MSVQGVTYWQVTCNDCGRSAQDGYFSAWEQREAAVDEAEEKDWLVTTGGQAWCSTHAQAVPCADCAHAHALHYCGDECQAPDCKCEQHRVEG